MPSPTEIYENLDRLVAKRPEGGAFCLGLMTAVGAPTSTITKLKPEFETGSISWGRLMRFEAVGEGLAASTLSRMRSEAVAVVRSRRHRILIAYDGATVAAHDTKVGDDLTVGLEDLPEEGDFFFPMGGIERYVPAPERIADVRATRHITRFFDAVRTTNPEWGSDRHRHDMNVFMARVLFCLFAQDVGIFKDDLFTTFLRQSTKADGSDLAASLSGAFAHMDVKPEDRETVTRPWSRLPYVNGTLFTEKTEMPTLGATARRKLMDCCALDWREINPDIFGSMLQAVVDVDKRGELGMHYTSPTNIMKVLDPLFLNSLRSELDAASTNRGRLNAFLDRLSKIRVLDPACGSGNFLILAYKEMRNLEMEAFSRLGSATRQGVKLENFFGIEYDDFACQAARLGLWVAQFQMNELHNRKAVEQLSFLPLEQAGQIVHANSARLDWKDVCPDNRSFETYVAGNPPFKGATWQTAEQKTDMKAVFQPLMKTWGELDYVAIWFAKAAAYAKATGASFALVSTNSIVQGVQVAALWPTILDTLEIRFAHRSFRWANLASRNAGVTCVIVGVGPKQNGRKILIDGDSQREVNVIGPYLAEGTTTIIRKSNTPLSDLDPMLKGNQPTDGGHLLLDRSERDALLESYPEAKMFVRRMFGSKELLQGNERWCLWIDDQGVSAAMEIPEIRERLEKVRDMRLSSTKQATVRFSASPWSFESRNEARSHTIMIPSVSSESRLWLPVEVMDRSAIISNLLLGIYDGDVWQAAVLSSRMHRLWLDAVGGRLKEDLRYSNQLVWNTFPLPSLSDRRKAELEEHWWEIDRARKEAGPDRTLGELYDPKTMSADLLRAHRALDETIERIFGSRRYRSDDDRIEHMLQIYERLTAKEAA